jgi:hypothetical protein
MQRTLGAEELDEPTGAQAVSETETARITRAGRNKTDASMRRKTTTRSAK